MSDLWLSRAKRLATSKWRSRPGGVARQLAAAQLKRPGMNDGDILEVMGWKDIPMLRRYTATVAGELAEVARERFRPGPRALSGPPGLGGSG